VLYKQLRTNSGKFKQNSLPDILREELTFGHHESHSGTGKFPVLTIALNLPDENSVLIVGGI
jgi:hypothetical protein